MTAAAWAVAFVVAFAAAGALALGGPVDAPRDRGLHRRPTPTTGGLAILAACCLGAAVGSRPDLEVAAALALATALGAYAAADDLFDLGAGPKLLAQVAAAGLFAVFVAHVVELPLAAGAVLALPWALGALGVAFWLVVLGNAVNFMDGADGLVAGSVAIAAAAVAVVALLRDQPAVAAAAAALAAGNLGFLPWNLGPRLFQGDVGALFSSFALGALGVLLAARGAASPYLVPLAVLPLLLDALGTLTFRLARREAVWRPHKQHLYHRWLAVTGGSHLALSARVWLLTAACAAGAVVVELRTPENAGAALLAAVALLSTAWLLARRRFA